jgi:hypothetical protein
MTDAAAVFRLLRRDRMVIVGALVAAVVLAWAYLLLVAGPDGCVPAIGESLMPMPWTAATFGVIALMWIAMMAAAVGTGTVAGLRDQRGGPHAVNERRNLAHHVVPMHGRAAEIAVTRAGEQCNRGFEAAWQPNRDPMTGGDPVPDEVRRQSIHRSNQLRVARAVMTVAHRWSLWCRPRVPCGQMVDRLLDSPLEGSGFELVWGFSCQVVVFGFCRFFVRSWNAVLRPVACDQVRGAMMNCDRGFLAA